jgi:hypothetical protein
MLELEQWNSALSSITGTLVRGTERVSTAHCHVRNATGVDLQRGVAGHSTRDGIS